MIKVKKILVVSTSVMALGSFAYASMLDQIIYNVVGQASNAAGARLGDEIYYGSSSSKQTTQRRAPAKRSTRTSRMTDEKRIQKALSSLGFYRGKIDGQVNSFETRTAIKDMNIAYGISNMASLKPEVKESLIYLGTLFIFDRHLITNANGNRSKNKKIQVALKIHGYYHGLIDGAIGKKTRGSIGQYKFDTGLSAGNALDFEEEYQLISSAKEKNDRNLDGTINSLRTMNTQQQMQQPQHQAYVPATPVQQHPNTNQAYVAPTHNVQQPAPAQQAYVPSGQHVQQHTQNNMPQHAVAQQQSPQQNSTQQYISSQQPTAQKVQAKIQTITSEKQNIQVNEAVTTKDSQLTAE